MGSVSSKNYILKNFTICKSVQNRIDEIGGHVTSVGKLEVLNRFRLGDCKWRNQLRDLVADLIKLLK
jgi:hypothetical protein